MNTWTPWQTAIRTVTCRHIKLFQMLRGIWSARCHCFLVCRWICFVLHLASFCYFDFLLFGSRKEIGVQTIRRLWKYTSLKVPSCSLFPVPNERSDWNFIRIYMPPCVTCYVSPSHSFRFCESVATIGASCSFVNHPGGECWNFDIATFECWTVKGLLKSLFCAFAIIID